MPLSDSAAVYQLRIRLDRSSPLIWRRLLVTDATTIAELHATIQIAFGWSDSHLHQFVIHGKPYGIAYLGGVSFADRGAHQSLAFGACESVASGIVSPYQPECEEKPWIASPLIRPQTPL